MSNQGQAADAPADPHVLFDTKHQLFWKSDGHGFTGDLLDAGLFAREQAQVQHQVTPWVQAMPLAVFGKLLAALLRRAAMRLRQAGAYAEFDGGLTALAVVDAAERLLVCELEEMIAGCAACFGVGGECPDCAEPRRKLESWRRLTAPYTKRSKP